MQLSREGSGCGGHSDHRHRHHLRQILPPTTPPTSPPTASAEIATITVNPAHVALAAVSAVLRKGARGGVTGGGGGRREGPAMNDYSRESASVGEGSGRQRYQRGRR